MKLSSRQEPMLAPSDLLGIDFFPEARAFPALMSIKYNGVRGISLHADRKTGPTWYSRRMEPLQLCEPVVNMMQDILDYSVQHSLVFDGEFYSPSLNKVGKTMSVLRGTEPVPDDFVFMCFYAIPYSVWNMGSVLPMYELLAEPIPGLSRFRAVEQKIVHSWDQFESVAEETRNNNLEGYMYLNPNAYYKHGRTTTTEGILHKYKYYTDAIDATIYSIEPMQTMKEGVSRSRNAIGHLKKVHTQDSYTTSNIGGTLWAHLGEGKMVKLPFPKGTSYAERAMYFAEFGTGSENDLKGKRIQFKKLACEDGEGAIAVKEVEFRD